MSEQNVAQRAAAVVKKSQRALASGDVEGYVSCFTPDAFLSDPLAPSLVGHEAIRQGVQKLVGLFAKTELQELKLFPVGRTVAFLARVHFVTHHGREATLESVDVFELNEDFRIFKGNAYYDVAPMLKLLQE